MNVKNYLAIDIGASSGRHIVAHNGELTEVYRFRTGFDERDGHFYTDVERLTREIVEGIRRAFAQFGEITSLAIDTWGVDYVRMRGEETLFPVFAYRDERTAAAIDAVHGIVPFAELYARTGIQFEPFNTVYQLYDDLTAGRLAGVTDFLMLPEYFNYRLTGKKVKEYTNATTTGLINAETKEFDKAVIARLGLPAALFPPLAEGGTVVGDLLPEIAAQVGGSCRVMLCFSHDTASAVEGIPMSEPAPYLISGTWSLLGIKSPVPHTDAGSRAANYSNEGGRGRTFRYQKNITGMWAVNRAYREMNVESAAAFEMLANDSTFAETVDLNAPAFLNPPHFVTAIRETLTAAGKPAPRTAGDVSACIHHSLAALYAEALAQLEQNTGKRYEKLYIVGGGARDKLLNALTARATGKTVEALPIEASALGNIKIQKEYDP